MNKIRGCKIGMRTCCCRPKIVSKIILIYTLVYTVEFRIWLQEDGTMAAEKQITNAVEEMNERRTTFNLCT